MSRLGRLAGTRGIGGWVFGMEAPFCFTFFGGLCDGARGGGLELSWVCVGYGGRSFAGGCSM